MGTEPKTFDEAVAYFSNPDSCFSYLISRRWPGGEVTCPTCGSSDVRFLASRRIWECKKKHPQSQFSIRVGTVFEDSPISLDKWLIAIWMFANSERPPSSYEIARVLGVTQKSAWFMLKRIQTALELSEQPEMVESQEAANGSGVA
jgi:transposase-like protein